MCYGFAGADRPQCLTLCTSAEGGMTNKYTVLESHAEIQVLAERFPSAAQHTRSTKCRDSVGHLHHPATWTKVRRWLVVREWRVLLLLGHFGSIICRIDCLAEVNVIEVKMVSEVAVNACQKAHLDLGQLQAEGAHGTGELIPGDETSLGPIHVGEHWLDEHPTLSDDGADLVLDPCDLVAPVVRQLDRVSPGRCSGGSVWHKTLSKRVLLQARCHKASVDFPAEVGVAEETILPHVRVDQLLEIGFINFFTKI